ncbi:MAG: hypothetical protein V1862_13235 [Methanobacteriota archaeon]
MDTTYQDPGIPCLLGFIPSFALSGYLLPIYHLIGYHTQSLRIAHPKITVLIFPSGKVVMTGVKSHDDFV